MKLHSKLLVFFVLICLFLTGCGGPAAPTAPVGTENPVLETAEPTAPAELVDYAAMELDMTSDTLKLEVTVKSFIDGDTTHYYVPEDVMAGQVLKARYLAVNTPESTGKIEEYGKAASRFTREKLENAASILIESEDGSWNADSTGDRFLVWVWYQPQGGDSYRNLNVELLQEGLAIANSAAGNRYGETCMAAINQAKLQKLNLYSGKQDPDFYYGEAIELTLKELRTNIESYNGMKVAFNGVVTTNSGTQGVYVEDYDTETDLYYGMYIYYGHGLSGTGLNILKVGNQVRIVGTVQFYEAGGTWQVSDISYRMIKTDDPGNIQKLGEGFAPAYRLTGADTFVNGQVTIRGEEESMVFPYGELALGTSVEIRDLTVVDVYTTEKEDSASKGAMTLTCETEGGTLTVRIAVLLDENGSLITADRYLGKRIDVKGIVDYYDGAYQIKVFVPDNILIKE